MKSFTTGLIAGGIAVAAGVSYVMKDKKMQKNIISSGKSMVNKAESTMDDITRTINHL